MLRIAICDDDKILVTQIEEMLNRYLDKKMIDRYIEIFYDGASLERIYEKGDRFDIIYLDIEMSGKNGIEAAKSIRRLDRDDADLCIIVGNALDNAIDGTKDIEGAKKIEISMGVKQGNFLLKVKNTFNPELIKFDNNGKRLRTSKTDKSNHGMGIGLIEETALKYNGLMEITMNENIFCLSVLLYQN